MKNGLKRYLSLLMVLIMCLSFLPASAMAEGTENAAEASEQTENLEVIPAVEEESIVEEEPAHVIPESVTIDAGKTELTVGEMLQLHAIVLPENAEIREVIWASEDESVLTVDSCGLVTAVSEGTAVIRATVAGNAAISGTVELKVSTAETIADDEINDGAGASEDIILNYSCASNGDSLNGISFAQQKFSEMAKEYWKDYAGFRIWGSYTVDKSMTIPEGKYISVITNNSQDGKLVVPEGVTLTINGDLYVEGDADLLVRGKLIVNGYLGIYGNGYVSISGSATINTPGWINITESGGYLYVPGDITSNGGGIESRGTVTIYGNYKMLSGEEEYDTSYLHVWDGYVGMYGTLEKRNGYITQRGDSNIYGIPQEDINRIYYPTSESELQSISDATGWQSVEVQIADDITIYGDVDVGDIPIWLQGSLTISNGATFACGSISCSGSISISGSLSVLGYLYLSGYDSSSCCIVNNTGYINAQSLSIDGTMVVYGRLECDSINVYGGLDIRYGTLVNEPDSITVRDGGQIVGLDSSKLSTNYYVDTAQELYDAMDKSANYKHVDIYVESSLVIYRDITIPENVNVLNFEGYDFTVPKGVQVTNEGSLVLFGNIFVNGTIVNNGFFTLYYDKYSDCIENNGELQLIADASSSDSLYKLLNTSANIIRTPYDSEIKIGKSITIPEEKTLSIEGTVTVQKGCTLTNNGTIELCGRELYVYGSYVGNPVLCYDSYSSMGCTLYPESIPHRTEDRLADGLMIAGNATVSVNSENHYSAEFVPADTWNQDVNWSIISSNELAFIDEYTGVLTTGNETGIVTIRAEAQDGSGQYADFQVEIEVFTLKITGEAELSSGQSTQLKAEFEPYNLTEAKIIWSLEEGDERFASIDASGKLTAFDVSEQHTVTVIAETSDGVIPSASFDVTVYPAAEGVLICDLNEELCPSAMTVNLNQSADFTLKAKVYPEDAVGSIMWSSSDMKGTMGTYLDNGDGTVSVSLDRTAAVGAVQLTASDRLSGKKAVITITTSRKSTGMVINNPLDGQPLESGNSAKFTATIQGEASDSTVIWSIPDEYSAYATVSKGTVKALDVTEPHSVLLVAETKDGGAYAEESIQIVPKAASILMSVNGDTVDGEYIIYPADTDEVTIDASVLPEGAKQGVVWLGCSDKFGTFTQNGNALRISDMSGATGALTVTVQSTDKAAKKSRIKLVFAKHAEDVEILSKQGKTLEEGLELKGGSSYTFKDSVSTLKDKSVTDKNVVWSISDYTYADIAKGKLAVKSFVTDAAKTPVSVTVTAALKADPTICDTYEVMLVPDKSSQISILLDGEKPEGTAKTVDITDGSLPVSAECIGLDADTVSWNPQKTNGAAYYSNGRIILNKKGSVTITATGTDVAGKIVKASFKLTVANLTENVKIESKTGTDYVIAGRTLNLTAKLNEGGTKPTNSKVTWSLGEGDNAYATISSSGVVKANKATKQHTITACCTSQDNGTEAEPFKITIYPAATKVAISGVPDNSTVDLNATDSIQLSARVYPCFSNTESDANANQSVTWSSSSKDYRIDENGLVSIADGAKASVVTFTAVSADGKKTSCKISFVKYVKSIDLDDAIVSSGKTLTLSAKVLDADATNKKLEWSVSNSNWATIKDGKLTAKKVTGVKRVTVTATALDGSGVSGTCTVTIYPVY